MESFKTYLCPYIIELKIKETMKFIVIKVSDFCILNFSPDHKICQSLTRSSNIIYIIVHNLFSLKLTKKLCHKFNILILCFCYSISIII